MSVANGSRPSDRPSFLPSPLALDPRTPCVRVTRKGGRDTLLHCPSKDGL